MSAGSGEPYAAGSRTAGSPVRVPPTGEGRAGLSRLYCGSKPSNPIEPASAAAKAEASSALAGAGPSRLCEVAAVRAEERAPDGEFVDPDIARVIVEEPAECAADTGRRGEGVCRRGG
ncbi:hypothetical protein OIE69_39495 [Actinacidiphila glaucinigra]|uniref:hypothetical protein n=1 Tax=Actinacidiphila glaucinigra TaxID=235986 RepID=UPI002DDAE937|nr:hypothetical protein [Actinacidiphila glaucinigra]WSD64550.1 hypothetical protein OIE69_39495 [Actinacidiphila glaucinigra]